MKINDISRAILVNDSKITQLQEYQPSELDIFRQEMAIHGTCPNLWPYERYKRSAIQYRFIFSSFSLLFAFLFLWVLFFHPVNWIPELYFGLFKTLLGVICGMLSFGSFMAIFSIQPEREAVNHYIKKTKKRIQRLYKRQLTVLGWRRFLIAFTKDCLSMRHAYEETMDLVSDLQEATLSLLTQVSRNRQLDLGRKIRLFNMALLELREQLNGLIIRFNKQKPN